MLKILLIALGGAAGALLRYTLVGWIQRLTDTVFPIGTLVINVLGCFVIGVLGAYFAGPHLVREEYRAAVLIGLLGAFTTFSTYGWETFELVNDRQFAWAGLNLLLGNGLGLAGVWLGYRITEHWVGA